MATPVKCAVQLDRIKGAKIAPVHFRAGWAGVLSERSEKRSTKRSCLTFQLLCLPTATTLTCYSKTTIN